MQREFPFLSLMPAPQDAPQALVVRITCKQEAVAVALRASGFKQAWFAAQLGISNAYLSLIRNGKREVPEWMVKPFCVLAGSNLLRQYMRFQEAMAVVHEQHCAERVINQLAQELRRAA